MEIKEDISNIKGGINKVVIKLAGINDTIKLSDGTKLYLETK